MRRIWNFLVICKSDGHSERRFPQIIWWLFNWDLLKDSLVSSTFINNPASYSPPSRRIKYQSNLLLPSLINAYFHSRFQSPWFATYLGYIFMSSWERKIFIIYGYWICQVFRKRDCGEWIWWLFKNASTSQFKLEYSDWYCPQDCLLIIFEIWITIESHSHLTN